MLHKKLEDVEYKLPNNIKADSELVIGEADQKLLKDKTANHLRDARVVEFFKNVTGYFTAAADYLKSHLPLADPLLHQTEVVDVTSQAEASVQSEIFPSAVPMAAA